MCGYMFRHIAAIPRPSKNLKIKITIACATVIDNCFVRNIGLTIPAHPIHVLGHFFLLLSFFFLSFLFLTSARQAAK